MFALESIAINIYHTFLALMRDQVTWGFAFGFIASTIIHLLVISDHPKRIVPIMTKSPEASYQYLHQQAPNEPGYKTFEHFKREYHRVRIVVLCTVIAIVVIALLALIRY